MARLSTAARFYGSVIFRYLAIVIPSVIVACSVMIWLISAMSREQAGQDAVAERQAVLDIMAGALGEPLWNFDESAVSDLASGLLDRPDVVGIRVDDSLGVTFAEFGTLPIDDVDGAEALAIHIVETPIAYRNAHIEETAGALVVSFDNGMILSRIVERQKAAIMTMMGAVAVVLFLAFFALRPLIHKPLVQLERAITHATTGERYQPIANRRTDEFGHLTAAFNRLLDSLNERETELKRRALTDPLTGLPNRTRLANRLEEQLETAAPFTVCVMDLNEFKQVNDTLGHAVGDELICAVAERLRAHRLENDTIVRLGGDEFAILVEASRETSLDRANRYLTVLNAPFETTLASLHVTASMGVASYPCDGDNASDLVRAADVAMYEAKRCGIENALPFDPAMLTSMLDEKAYQDIIRDGLVHGWFSLEYQDIVSTGDASIVGVEALLRLNHPERGRIRPDIFVPVAERSGLIRPLGRWLIAQAFADLARARSRLRGREIFFSINLSPLQIDDDLPDALMELAERFEIMPSDIRLEITETALMAQSADVPRMIGHIRNLGFKISLDDFGTGYSSLVQMRDFPIDSIKIDRSFIVSACDETDEARSFRSLGILRGLATMSEAMGVPLVAEGIETRQQHALIEQLGVSMAQGYRFARPEPFEQWLARHAEAAPSHRPEPALVRPSARRSVRPGTAAVHDAAEAVS